MRTAKRDSGVAPLIDVGTRATTDRRTLRPVARDGVRRGSRRECGQDPAGSLLASALIACSLALTSCRSPGSTNQTFAPIPGRLPDSQERAESGDSSGHAVEVTVADWLRYREFPWTVDSSGLSQKYITTSWSSLAHGELDVRVSISHGFTVVLVEFHIQTHADGRIDAAAHVENHGCDSESVWQSAVGSVEVSEDPRRWLESTDAEELLLGFELFNCMSFPPGHVQGIVNVKRR